MSLGRALQAQGNANEARTAFRSAAEQLEHAGGPGHLEARAARQLPVIRLRLFFFLLTLSSFARRFRLPK